MTVYVGFDTALGPDHSCAVAFRHNPDGTVTMLDSYEIPNSIGKRINMARGLDGVWRGESVMTLKALTHVKHLGRP